MKEENIPIYIANQEKKRKLSKEQISLIEADLRFGLEPKEIERYSETNLDYEQMQIYSKCLRSEYPDELISVICAKGLNAWQMQVVFDYHKKGIPMDALKAIADGSKTAATMQKAYLDILENLAEAEKAVEQEPAYVKGLLEEFKQVADKIDYQEKRYDALNGMLIKLQESGKEEKKEELAERDAVLEDQQDKINRANATIARLRKEVEELKVNQQRKEENGVPQEKRPIAPKLPIGYQAVLVNAEGERVSYLPIEKVQQKKSKVGVLAKLGWKKKSRQDIVRLVAEGELETEQLVQIKEAIKNGLTESQLVELIHCKLSAEQMQEIIEIAVLENCMED